MNYIIEFISENLQLIYILILAIFIGVELIKNVPTVLHTPLMSGANAISGVVLVGSIFFLRSADADDYLALSIGSLAMIMAMINIVGGFAVTNRMLAMFKKKKS